MVWGQDKLNQNRIAVTVRMTEHNRKLKKALTVRFCLSII
ncbi:hypothetical protein HMPREF1548_06755 [Clostridium sp. KLE 1755]|nr:hypothetical protein HMPREF1548_06755 [Clostridium sp. KLE 1755]